MPLLLGWNGTHAAHITMLQSSHKGAPISELAAAQSSVSGLGVALQFVHLLSCSHCDMYSLSGASCPHRSRPLSPEARQCTRCAGSICNCVLFAELHPIHMCVQLLPISSRLRGVQTAVSAGMQLHAPEGVHEVDTPAAYARQQVAATPARRNSVTTCQPFPAHSIG